MDAGINDVMYMELYSGPKMANDECGKTIDTGTIDRGSTVLVSVWRMYNNHWSQMNVHVPFVHGQWQPT
jgi:hypothetical protein